MSSLLGRPGDAAAVPALWGTAAASERPTRLPIPPFSTDAEVAMAPGTPAPPCPISTSPTRAAEVDESAALPTIGTPSAVQTIALKAPPQPLLPLSPTAPHRAPGDKQMVVADLSALEEDPSASWTFSMDKNREAESLYPDPAAEIPICYNASVPEASQDAIKETPFTAPTSPEVLGFSKSVERPWITRLAAQKQANVRNFLNTLFSSPLVSASGTDLGDDRDLTRPHPEPNATTNSYSLEWAIRGSIESSLNFVSSSVSQALASTKTSDRNSYLDNSLDRLEDNSEEGLEHLRRVVNIVMQVAKQQSSSEDDLTQRNGGGGHFTAGAGTMGSGAYA
ncbi:unnamed protein product [Phytomonas sp. Hart1]|nr:unnamed protein product [Phytomonas sp. Hart1]|eukprot:CCW66988.1 unnamed protein product [Phytomonas sp. isolate Hart1]